MDEKKPGRPDFSNVAGGSSPPKPGSSEVAGGGTPRKADFSNVVGGSSSTAPSVKNGPQAQSARTYVVQKGDSLSKIAKKFYGDAGSWKRIFEANRDVVKNPDLIQPGWTLKIPE